MGFFDKFVSTYSQGYQQKLAESRAQEDSERDVRLKMYQAALADDTLTDDERHHILNEMGRDTEYKHDPKVFGLFAPPGHIAHQKGANLGDLVYGMSLDDHRRVARSGGSGGDSGGGGVQVQTPNPAGPNTMMMPTSEMPGARDQLPPMPSLPDDWNERLPDGRTVYEAASQNSPHSQPFPQLPPPPGGAGAPIGATPGLSSGINLTGADGMTYDTNNPGGALVRQLDGKWRWQGQAVAGQLPPPPSEAGNAPTQYPPGYAPDKSSRAGRREASQVREAWAQVQGQAELMKRRGFTEKMDSVIDADTGELVQTFFNPATGRTKEFRTKGLPPNVVVNQAKMEQSRIFRTLTALKGQKLDPADPQVRKLQVDAERWGIPFDVESFNDSKGNLVRYTRTDPAHPEQTVMVERNVATGEETVLGQKGFQAPRNAEGMTAYEKKSVEMGGARLDIARENLKLAEERFEQAKDKPQLARVHQAQGLLTKAKDLYAKAEYYDRIYIDGEQPAWARNKAQMLRDQAKELEQRIETEYDDVRVKEMSLNEFRKAHPDFATDPAWQVEEAAHDHGIRITDYDSSLEGEPGGTDPRTRKAKQNVSRGKARGMWPEQLKGKSDAEVDDLIRAQGFNPIP
jgi:hypothetical protein